MRISDLIGRLEHLMAEHGDLPVLQAIDPEGNGFRPVDDLNAGVDRGDCDYASHPNDVRGKTPNAVCIWPGGE